MPQLDQSAFLNHAFFIYLLTSGLTIFFICWVLPKLLITFRARQYLSNYRHPVVSNVHAMAQWAAKRHWIATMCNWRNTRIFANFHSHQLYNLQNIFTALYHPYWKNVNTVSYLADSRIGTRLYALRMTYFFYLSKNNPIKAQRKYKKAVELFSQYNQHNDIPIEIRKLREQYWKRTINKDTRFKSHNHDSIFTINTHFFKRIKLFSEMRAANDIFFLKTEHWVSIKRITNTIHKYYLYLKKIRESK